MRNHTSIGDSLSLVQSLEAYHGTAAKLVQIKKLQIPTFDQQNPQIKSPLSKPQVEGLLHLVDEQRTRRAGPLWKDYHHALALTESIRYLQQFTSAIAALHQRALEVEQLQVRHQVEAELKIVAERQAKEAAQKVAAEAERKAKEAAQKAKPPPGGPDLAALALISDSIDVPYLLAGSENESDLGLYVVSGGKPVAVRPATFDAERQVYSLILDNPNVFSPGLLSMLRAANRVVPPACHQPHLARSFTAVVAWIRPAQNKRAIRL